MERHIEDSLESSYASLCVAFSYEALNLFDFGTGAGLIDLILAIACPVGITGLTNVRVGRGRAENFGQDVSFREVFARAVAEIQVLAENCLPLVRKGGLFVAAKGHSPEEEVRNAEKAIEILGASVLQTCPVESHSPHGQRTAIVCLKTRSTPSKYPRDPGTPAKLPL